VAPATNNMGFAFNNGLNGLGAVNSIGDSTKTASGFSFYLSAFFSNRFPPLVVPQLVLSFGRFSRTDSDIFSCIFNTADLYPGKVAVIEFYVSRPSSIARFTVVKWRQSGCACPSTAAGTVHSLITNAHPVTVCQFSGRI